MPRDGKYSFIVFHALVDGIEAPVQSQPTREVDLPWASSLVNSKVIETITIMNDQEDEAEKDDILKETASQTGFQQ